MRFIKPWVAFSERTLKFQYPTSYREIAASTFVKKLVVDLLPFNLIVFFALFLILRPQDDGGAWIAIAKIILGCVAIGVLVDLAALIAEKMRRDRQ